MFLLLPSWFWSLHHSSKFQCIRSLKTVSSLTKTYSYPRTWARFLNSTISCSGTWIPTSTFAPAPPCSERRNNYTENLRLKTYNKAFLWCNGLRQTSREWKRLVFQRGRGLKESRKFIRAPGLSGKVNWHRIFSSTLDLPPIWIYTECGSHITCINQWELLPKET